MAKSIYIVTATGEDGQTVHRAYTDKAKAERVVKKLNREHLKLNGSMDYFSGWYVEHTLLDYHK